MATIKHRINISLSDGVTAVLTKLAKRDQVPTATKTAELIQRALEIEEDDVFNAIAAKRDVIGTKFASHKKAWA